MPSILFVCTANICRSPLAEALMKDIVSRLPDASNWRIASAGTWADDGYEAAYYSQRVMQARGIDLSNHLSQPVTAELLESFDLVLTMERGHKEALQAEFPAKASLIFMLSEMVGSEYDINDPIGGVYEDYEATAKELEGILNQGMDRIQQLMAPRKTARIKKPGRKSVGRKTR